MKVKMVSVLCALIVVAAALTAAFLLPAGQQTLASATGSISQSVDGFTVKEYEGKVAVFSQGSDTPEQVIDVYVKNLPVEEQKKLADGIRVKTRGELLALLENYES